MKFRSFWKVIPNFLHTFPLTKVHGMLCELKPILKGEAHLADEMYKGRFWFSGEPVVASHAGIFHTKGLSRAAYEELYGFSWFIHLTSSPVHIHRLFALSLLVQWWEGNFFKKATARLPLVAARRFLSLLTVAPFLFKEADPQFSDIFYKILQEDSALLQEKRLRRFSLREKLAISTAFACGTICLRGLENSREKALKELENELDRQIYPDGGHISRSPAVLLSLLLDLLPLRQALETTHQTVPSGLFRAIERMLPSLRFFTHGDDGLCAFAGVKEPSFKRVRAILENDTAFGRPLNYAPYSQYCRMSQGPLTVIADTGHPPDPSYNFNGGMSCLAFELSDGPQRIIVNCGSSDQAPWRDLLKLTAAHSTIELGSSQSASALQRARPAYLLKRWGNGASWQSSGNVLVSPAGHLMEGWHAAYSRQFGILVKRRLYLASNGRELRGEDFFAPDLEGGTDIELASFTSRFHLHPSIHPSLEKDQVLLELPNGILWHFHHQGGALSLEESVYTLGTQHPRRTNQIVLRGDIGTVSSIRWALKKEK